MKRIGILLGLAVVAFLPQAGAQEGITAYSALMNADVRINVLKVTKTRMSDQDFCTLLTGTYCGPMSVDMAQPRILLQ